MADFSCVSTKRSSDWSSPMSWKPPVRLRVIVAVAAFALAGCNVNQTPNASTQGAYNPYNPVDYAQTSGHYAGR